MHVGQPVETEKSYCLFLYISQQILRGLDCGYSRKVAHFHTTNGVKLLDLGLSASRSLIHLYLHFIICQVYVEKFNHTN